MTEAQDVEPVSDGYGSSRIGHTVPTERRRLQMLEQVADPVTIEVLRGLGIEPHWRCLELGAGAGSVARWLAKECDTVVATDKETSFLSEKDAPNMIVLEHDVVTDTFPKGAFDLIHARFLFEHLRDRESVLAKVVDWLAPGGYLVVEDFAGFPIEWSPYAEVRQLWAAGMRYLRVSIGTDMLWAPNCR